MTKQTSFKPCPFCGSEKAIYMNNVSEGVYWVFCFRCNATGPPKDTEAKAFEAWNERTEKE